jgi:hypothetical protein
MLTPLLLPGSIITTVSRYKASISLPSSAYNKTNVFKTFSHHQINITMSAMTQSRQQVYVSGDFSEPMSAQHNFANNFDLDNPDAAMSAYQRIMHEHTKRQLSTATDSARRRSGASSTADLRSLESVSSTES